MAIRRRLFALPEWLGPWLTPLLLLGLSTALLQHGIFRDKVEWEFGIVTCLAMLARVLVVGLQTWRSDHSLTFFRQNRRPCLIAGAWTVGAIVLLLFGPVLPVWFTSSRGAALVAWSEQFLLLAGGARLLGFVLKTMRGGHPALVFVLSFIGMILVGAGLLMLPGSLSEKGQQLEGLDRVRVALFTSTSASCVTGLAVVPTGGPDANWSRFGQVVILTLFQIGGLGMMTLSTTFALLAGRRLAFRESRAVVEMTEAVTIREVRQLMLSIVGFTLVCEAIGGVLLSTLWSDLPLAERAFFGMFHSVSAFCNAGFALTGQSFLGLGGHWQIWGVAATLIIVGGIGFGTMMTFLQAVRTTWSQSRDEQSLFRHRRLSERLTLTQRLVVRTTLALLLGGAFGYWLIESVGVNSEAPFVSRVSEAWFQSVTFRTAGFNTVDHGAMQPATKLFAIAMMFIGASPGSTGGGIKTVAVAISVLSVLSILRGRRNVECHGRQIPDEQVRYAFVIVAMGLVCTMITTLLLTLFERSQFDFLDILFESTSAFATVGVSTGLTSELSTASQLVLIVTMFLGRVGPLTLLLALTRMTDAAWYQYPEERVALG
ncbi:MAG: TrkH family potassium uptake protein [Planctomycetota bacterium]|jgi:trk system potassium uptake protein TrkH